MNRHGLIIAAGVAATLAAGCASTDNQKRVSEDEKTYVTGSRIPVKESPNTGVKAITDRQSIEDMVRPRGATGGVVGAGGG